MVDKITSPVSELGLINKVNEIIENSSAITVDTVIDSSSTNPVQNKVIASALSAKANTSDIGNGQIVFTQGGVAKGTITANQSTATTIALDGSSGGSSSLAGLSDVTLTSATTGQVLGYNGTVWVNTTPTTVTFRVWS